MLSNDWNYGGEMNSQSLNWTEIDTRKPHKFTIANNLSKREKKYFWKPYCNQFMTRKYMVSEFTYFLMGPPGNQRHVKL